MGPKKRKVIEVAAHLMSPSQKSSVKEAHVRRAVGSKNGHKRIVTSAALDKALSNIGVNEETIQLRRTTRLYIEALCTIIQQSAGMDCDTYCFGSQSEGSTTEGMDSDTDFLHCDRSLPVIQNITDRKFEQKQLFVVTDMPPPQCCCLQLLCPDNSVFSSEDGVWIDAQGRVFLKKTNMLLGGDDIQHGPALRFRCSNIDLVNANHCAKLPEDCQYIFRRPKPGHWPRPELLTQLRNNGVFLGSPAHVENTTNWDHRQHLGTLTLRKFDNSHALYWRLSTNLMERLLMFDLKMAQMKVYVIMKIIRKEFCKPLVDDRLSTFHLKTALLYSVEMSPPHIWDDENLIQCLKLCLTTLKRWLKVRYCPHYTTVNVNLFDGKLRLNEFPVLIELFTDMIRNDVSCLYNVRMDDLGSRISSNSTAITNGIPFEELDIVIASKMLNHLISSSCGYFYHSGLLETVENSKVHVINYHARYIEKLETINKTSTGYIRSAVSIRLPFHYSMQAVMKASMCIGKKQTLSQEIFTLCYKSLMSDVTSSRLKLASIYFSVGRFEEAAAILKQLDALISKKVIHLSPFLFNKNNKFDPEFLHMLQNEVAVCTIFIRHEINCVPGQLVAEFYRTITVEDANCRNPNQFWMDFAVVDSLPYMYYLQFLLFRHTG